MAILNSAHQAKKLWEWLVRTAAGWFTSESCQPKRFSVLEKSSKKISSRTATQSVPLFKPEHGFCQQNGPERGQILVFEWKNGSGSHLFEW